MTRPCIVAALATALAAAPVTAEELRVYNWADYFAPDTLERFTAETGISVVYDTYDSDELLMTRLLTGGSGYDVVFPGSAFAADMLAAGIFQPLDPALAPKAGIDPAIQSLVIPSDADMTFTVPYTTAITGFAYNADAIAARLPGVTLDSWAALFAPDTAARLADCGVAVIDAPNDLIQIALRVNGRPVTSTEEADLAAARATLETLSPAVRYYSSARIISDLANGDICLAITWTGDGLIAAARAKEVGGPAITVVVPREGSVFQANMMAIPADAPNPSAANRFIAFLQRPDIQASIVAWVNYGTANREAAPLLPPEIASAPGIAPTADQIATLWPAVNPPPGAARKLTRLWSEVKAGK